LDPVRARLTALPHDWSWSSAPAHLAGSDDALVRVAPLAARVDGIRALIDEPEAGALARLRAARRTGRPLGSDAFVARLEALSCRPLRRRKPGRKPRVKMAEGSLGSGQLALPVSTSPPPSPR